MSINESLETCAKYQEYKIDGRVRGEEREIFEEIVAQTFTCAWKHLLKISICSQPQARQIKEESQRIKSENNIIEKEKKRSTYEGRMVYCDRQ